ncbi:MAG: hypothetical protein QOI24_1442 [Acidobacteriota bacterium]|jgi:hypothetical protein|nr:hypothetical protein [Acidobacteriota bacterium]
MDELMTKRLRTTIALAATLFAAAAYAGPHVTHSFNTSAPAGSVRRVLIDIEAGDIKIRNSTTGTINVTGIVKRESDYDEREKNQRIVNDSSAEIYVSHDEAIVRRKFGANAQGWRAQTHNTDWDLTIEVPAGVSIDLATRYGDIDIEGTYGNIDVDLRAGDIDVKTPRTAVRELVASCRVGEIHTHLGDEIIEREGLLPGKTHWVNKNATGTSVVHVHATAGEVNVVLTK